MIDIRAICKVFLDFIYDNKILPESIIKVLDDYKNSRWDFRKVCDILKCTDRSSSFGKNEKASLLDKALREQIDKTSFYKNPKFATWLQRSSTRFEIMCQDLNNYFHNVAEDAYIDAWIDAIKAVIREKAGEDKTYIQRINNIMLQENTSSSNQTGETNKLKDEITELKAKIGKLESENEALRATKITIPSNNDFIQNPTKEFFINGQKCSSKEFAKYLQNANRIVYVTIFYSDKDPKNCIWRVSHFSETSDLNGNLNGGFLRGWKDKGITGIKLELNK